MKWTAQDNGHRANVWPTRPPDEPGKATSPTDKFQFFSGELREYIDYYLTAKTDKFKFTVRRFVMKVVGISVLLFAATTAGATAIVFLLLGIAGGLSELFGWTWQSQLAVGGTLLAFLGGGLLAGITFRRERERQEMLEKYERRRRYQRARFGHDAGERTAQRTTPA